MADEARPRPIDRPQIARADQRGMVDDMGEGPPLAAWHLLGTLFDNPTGVRLTPAHVERVLRDAGFQIEGAGTLLPGITRLTRASRPA